MTSARRISGIALVALLALTVSFGCSDTDDPAGQGSAEDIESERSSAATVDLSDGNIEVSDGEGGTVEIEAGEDASLPDGFPSDLELPGTTTIVQATNSATDGNDIQLVTVQFEGSVAEVYDAYKSQLEDAGYVIESESSGTNAGSEVANAVATKGSTTVSATFGADGAGSGTATISVQTA